VAEGSSTLFPGAFFCLIGDEQSLEHNLSSFSSHVKSTAALLQEVKAGDLVLLDELMGGTDPEEGSALALEVLYALAKRGALTVVTTHYSILKTMAREEPHFENACVEFDEEAFCPTFTILPGSAGPSRGFEIALRFGVPELLVEKARLRLGPERARLEELLRGVESDRLDTALARKQAVELQEELEARKQELERLRKELKETVYQEAQERAAKLDEELTRLRRVVLEALEEGRVRDAARAVEATASSKEELPAPPPKDGWEGLEVGDRVRVGGYGVVGVILRLDRDKHKARVDTGSLQVEVDLTRCEREAAAPPVIKAKKPKKRGQAVATKRGKDPSAMVFTEIHLIGMRAREAQEKLETEVDLAISLNADGVRVIHGFGTGTLKAMTWDILKNHDLVRELRPGGEYEGGRGATIAVFR
jgi:DNA mismatch repair protein MutS2